MTTTLVCGNQHSCKECEEFDRLQRETRIALEEELVKLRTGLARLAFVVGVGDHVPGKPGREAPFEVLDKAARANPRGWNALIGVLIDEYNLNAEHIESVAKRLGWTPEMNTTAALYLEASATKER